MIDRSKKYFDTKDFQEEHLILEVEEGKPSKETEIRYFCLFSPYVIKGYEYPPQTEEEMRARFEGIEVAPDEKGIENMKLLDDARRNKSFSHAANCGGRHLFNDLLKIVTHENGAFNAGNLFALMGSLAGAQCMLAFMSAVSGMTPEEIFSLNTVVFKSEFGDKYLIGSRIDNIYKEFCRNATKDEDIWKDRLEYLEMQSYADMLFEKAYQDTGMNAQIGMTPSEIARISVKRFEPLFRFYTRFPHERVMMCSFAAERIIEMLDGQMEKKRIIDFISAYGWKTAHYLDPELIEY